MNVFSSKGIFLVSYLNCEQLHTEFVSVGLLSGHRDGRGIKENRAHLTTDRCIL